MKTGRQLVVFDMDGVIVDVSGSYRETVIQSAACFMRSAAGAEKLPRPLFPLSDLARLKQSGGLNNDWDLTCRVLELLFRRVRKPDLPYAPDPWEGYAQGIARCDVSALAHFLAAVDRPLSALAGEQSDDADRFIRAFYTGDVGSGNVIKQIFQEIYLGQALFASTYGTAPRVYRGPGLIARETLLARPELFAHLAADHVLAIATGRPAAEAAHALRRFRIDCWFKTVYTLDDCLVEEARLLRQTGRRASLSKPDPFMLDTIDGEVEGPLQGRWYVGDMPDDIIAAARSRAGFKSVAVLKSAPDKEALRRRLAGAGADVIIDDLEQLPGLLSGEGSFVRGGDKG